YGSLNEYDVIIAMDPDWTALDETQLKLLEKWVNGPSAGGRMFVAGPAHTFQMARAGGHDLSPIQTMYPVVLKDARLHGLGIEHDPTRPYALNFTKVAEDRDFLKLDEASKQPLAGWEDFFWDGKRPESGKGLRPLRGLFNFYPVKEVKPGAIVLGPFDGPPGIRINDGQDELPFLVEMKYGRGRTFYIGSPELWRLRNMPKRDEETSGEMFHERLWVKLCRYVGSGKLNKLERDGPDFVGRPHSAGQGTVQF